MIYVMYILLILDGPEGLDACSYAIISILKIMDSKSMVKVASYFQMLMSFKSYSLCIVMYVKGVDSVSSI